MEAFPKSNDNNSTPLSNNNRRSILHVYRRHWFVAFLLGTFWLGNMVRIMLMAPDGASLDLQHPHPTRSGNHNIVTPMAKTKSKESHHSYYPCLNDDFVPDHKVSIWTMLLNDNFNYTKGAIMLGKAIQKQKHTTMVDQVVLQVEGKTLSTQEWNLLQEAGVGWTKTCIVPHIPAPHETRADLTEKFAVLHLWAMEDAYDKILFLDADTYVIRSIDPLLQMNLHGKPIGVTRDVRKRGKLVDTFNSGVMLLRPSTIEYQRLLKLLQSDLEYEYQFSDQGFLNAVYQNNWHDIGFIYNANMNMYKHTRPFWDQYNSTISIIHYTLQKPWKCRLQGPYGPLCALWKQPQQEQHAGE